MGENQWMEVLSNTVSKFTAVEVHTIIVIKYDLNYTAVIKNNNISLPLQTKMEIT